jgi:hypothetical protein
MNPLAWLNPARWLMLAGAVLAIVLGYQAWAAHQRSVGAAGERVQWQAAIAAQKAEAAATLAAATARTLTAERQLNAARAAREKIDAKNQNDLAGLRAVPLPGSHAAGGLGLRDPNATGCRGSSGGATGAASPGADAGAADRAQAGGLVSRELEALLLQLADEADTLNIAYASCRADAFEIRRRPP